MTFEHWFQTGLLPPAQAVEVMFSVPSVRLSVFLSVCPSVRLSVKNSDKEGTTREGRQRSGVFINNVSALTVKKAICVDALKRKKESEKVRKKLEQN